MELVLFAYSAAQAPSPVLPRAHIAERRLPVLRYESDLVPTRQFRDERIEPSFYKPSMLYHPAGHRIYRARDFRVRMCHLRSRGW